MLIAAAANDWNVDPLVVPRRKRRSDPSADWAKGLNTGPWPMRRRSYRFRPASRSRTRRTSRSSERPAKRIDTPDKVNGKAVFGIDAVVPGMKFAAVAACPVLGGKLAGVDDSKAMAIKGVRQVVRLDNAVAVVGDNTWAAIQGLAALDIDWDNGPKRHAHHR